MAIVVQGLDLKNFDVVPGINAPTTNYELPVGVTLANQFPTTSLVFPKGILSAAYWTVATGAISATTPALSVAVDWVLASGSTTAANVRFGAQVITFGVGGGATQPGNANAFTTSLGAAVNVDSAVTVGSPTPIPFLQSRAAIAVTVPVSFVAANGPFTIAVKVYRDGLATQDTASGDVKVKRITVLYQDT